MRVMVVGIKAASLLGNRKLRAMDHGQHRTKAQLQATFSPDDHPIWIHAASLGEFEQARPLIERLRREQPEKKLLLSFFSPSGYQVRKNYPFVDAVVYLPYDTPHRARRFLRNARPSMAIFVKYEFWGNYLEELHRQGIPTYSISAIFRPTQRFFRRGGEMFRRMLRSFTHIYVQDERSRRLLRLVGVDQVTVAGDTRFDRVTDVMRSAVDIPGFPGFGAEAPLRFIAGSSWEADEDIYVPWLRQHPEVAFVIAPHEFNETRLEKLRNRFDGGVVLLSEWVAIYKKNGGIPPEIASKVRGIIVDSFGKLASLYRYFDLAYIGGGFGAGIHNLNEAAVYGMPVVFGPNHTKFKEASDLIAAGGGFSVIDNATLSSTLHRLYASGVKTPALAAAGKAAGAYIAANLGATDRIYADLFPKQ